MLIVQKITKPTLLVITLISLQACSPNPNISQGAVAEAYNTSGTVPVSPYTRTIFSSHNF